MIKPNCKKCFYGGTFKPNRSLASCSAPMPKEPLSKLSDDLPYKASVKRVLMQAQEADVVPRAEVEELIRENKSLAKTVNEASELIRKLRSKVEKSKTEVAGKIFEEIAFIVFDNTFSRDGKTYFNAENIVRKIGKLKKKYTEEKKDDNQN